MAIGLGGNVGDPRAAFRAALVSLGAFVDRLVVSGLYRTAPVGGPPQPDFLNAVAAGRTRLPPLTLLDALKSIERAAGSRPDPGVRDGPRPLDLDLLLYGDETIVCDTLTVPHPRLGSRLFVLVPLAELMPRRVIPGLKRTVARLLREAPPAFVERLGPI